MRAGDGKSVAGVWTNEPEEEDAEKEATRKLLEEIPDDGSNFFDRRRTDPADPRQQGKSASRRVTIASSVEEDNAETAARAESPLGSLLFVLYPFLQSFAFIFSSFVVCPLSLPSCRVFHGSKDAVLQVPKVFCSSSLEERIRHRPGRRQLPSISHLVCVLASVDLRACGLGPWHSHCTAFNVAHTTIQRRRTHGPAPAHTIDSDANPPVWLLGRAQMKATRVATRRDLRSWAARYRVNQ